MSERVELGLRAGSVPRRPLLALLFAVGLLAPVRLAAAQTVNATINGVDYELSGATGSPTGALNTSLATTAWFGNTSAAYTACAAATTQLGVFAYFGAVFLTSFEPTVSGVVYSTIESVCQESKAISPVNARIFALSQVLTPPKPPPAPLDCTAAAFDPPMLSSRINSQICASNRAVRQGKPSNLVTAVNLSLLDANNQPTAINITNIVTNKATAGWQCACRPTVRDNCTCLPNAVLLGGGRFLAMPQWRRSTLPGRLVDTTLQVFFTATASDGGTCSGSAVICSAWGVRPNRPPPVCSPFNSTGVTRPALTCG